MLNKFDDFDKNRQIKVSKLHSNKSKKTGPGRVEPGHFRLRRMKGKMKLKR